MINEHIFALVRKEIEEKSFGVTEQFLEVHEVVKMDGVPRIDRIDTDRNDGIVIAYLPVVGEKFYMAVYFDVRNEIELTFVGTEPGSAVYFRAASDVYDLEQLASMTRLKRTNGFGKGDPKKGTNVFHKNSTIVFEPNPEPDEVEDKLKKLLDVLEQDREGVLRLVNECGGYIVVAMNFHNGNTMLGGPHIDRKSIERMHDLELSIDFDLYADGNFFKEE